MSQTFPVPTKCIALLCALKHSFGTKDSKYCGGRRLRVILQIPLIPFTQLLYSIKYKCKGKAAKEENLKYVAVILNKTRFLLQDHVSSPISVDTFWRKLLLSASSEEKESGYWLHFSFENTFNTLFL